MKIDTTKSLKTFDGKKEIKENGVVVRVRDVLLTALSGCKDKMGLNKVTRLFQLGVLISTLDEVEISSEDVSLLKTCVLSVFSGCLVSGQVCELLEGNDPFVIE